MSGHAILSPSSAHRWLECTPSPRLEAELPDSTSEYAAEGTLAHSVCELMAREKFAAMPRRTYTGKLNKLKADPLWDDEMLATASGYVERLMENAMRFSSAPYVALEVKVDISEYAPEAWGTCDCVMIGDDEIVITDYKHGKGVPVDAKGNPQMMLYALGALKLYQPIYGDAIANVRLCVDQPRINSYGTHSLTVGDLREWGEEVVKPSAAAAFAGEGEYRPGDWCRFCRAKAQCRARAGASTALEDFLDASPPAEAGTARGPLLSHAEVGELLHRGKALADWYESLKEYALATCLAGGEIPGWKAVEGRSQRAWTDQGAAIGAILEAGHPRELVYDTVPKTLAQLEKLLGAAPFDELAGRFVTKPPGKPALAPESDKRPPYSSAAADFAGAGQA